MSPYYMGRGVVVDVAEVFTQSVAESTFGK